MSEFNPFYVFIPVWITFLAIFVVLSFRARKLLPDLKSGTVHFNIKGASGYSNKSFITKAGGASGVLRISIIDNQLHFWTSPGFAAVAKMYDLIQAIPISSIIEINPEKRKMVIRYDSSFGQKEFVVRSMAKREEFLAILENLRHKKRARL